MHQNSPNFLPRNLSEILGLERFKYYTQINYLFQKLDTNNVMSFNIRFFQTKKEIRIVEIKSITKLLGRGGRAFNLKQYVF